MITILYATETGTAESLAEEASDGLTKLGLDVAVKDIGDMEVADLQEIRYLVAIVSTWGEGDPPSDAEDFFEEFRESDPIGLGSTKFCVLALGDTNYDDFCQFGKNLDAELERHGAVRMLSRVDCDVDYELPFELWLEEAGKLLSDELLASA